jgi:membrane protein implicated in regulation of membrane protease activity
MSLGNPFYIWLILAVLFVIVEIFTAGFFYACFAAGALCAMITGFVTDAALGNSEYGLVWQIVVFCVVSVILIPVSRSFARRVSDTSVPQAGVDAFRSACRETFWRPLTRPTTWARSKSTARSGGLPGNR